jgi:hypothetical protein
MLLALVSTGAAKTAFEISHRLGFYPERWLADLTVGFLSNDLAFWIIFTAVSLGLWVGLQLLSHKWFATTPDQQRTALIAVNNEGVALLNDGNLTTQVGEWTFRFSDWHRRLLEAAAAYSPELRNRLEPIKRFTVRDEPVAVNDPSHKINVKIVAEVMHRVDVWLAEKAKR